MRRFSETRRPHPLAPDRSVAEGIDEEREKMLAIRGMADLILDTSNLTVHELRDIFMRMSRDEGTRADMVVNLVSFGFKHGAPLGRRSGVRRALPAESALRRSAAPADRPRREQSCGSCGSTSDTQDFIDRLTSFLKFALPHYVQEGKSYLTVAIGCTGGQHRSVMIAEALKKSLGTTSRACGCGSSIVIRLRSETTGSR